MNSTNAQVDTSVGTFITSSPPIQYKTILVPHDGSTIADNALKHAIYLSNSALKPKLLF